MTKVLVLGAYGMLGHKLMTELATTFDVRGTCRETRKDSWARLVSSKRLIPGVDAQDLDSVRKTVGRVHPDVVVNCIGIIKQLEAAKNPLQSISVNSLFPHHLALICKNEGSRLIHFSTDCVFSGRKGKYKIDDPSDADDLYGKTKHLGELHDEHTVTIRSSIIGRELGTKNGLVEWFLSQEGKKVKGYANAIYTGFTTNEMARIVKLMIEDHPDMHGVWQVASKPTSKYDLLCLIRDIFDLDIVIQKDTKVKIDRSLDGAKFNKHTGYRPPTWESMIKVLSEDSKKYDEILRDDRQ